MAQAQEARFVAKVIEAACGDAELALASLWEALKVASLLQDSAPALALIERCVLQTQSARARLRSGESGAAASARLNTALTPEPSALDILLLYDTGRPEGGPVRWAETRKWLLCWRLGARALF